MGYIAVSAAPQQGGCGFDSRVAQYIIWLESACPLLFTVGSPLTVTTMHVLEEIIKLFFWCNV